MRWIFWPAIVLDLAALAVAIYFAVDAGVYGNAYGEIVLLLVASGLLALIGLSISMWRSTKRIAALVLALLPALPTLCAGVLMVALVAAAPTNWH